MIVGLEGFCGGSTRSRRNSLAWDLMQLVSQMEGVQQYQEAMFRGLALHWIEVMHHIHREVTNERAIPRGDPVRFPGVEE